MNILVIEPFYAGSHQRWAEEYQRASTHTVQCLKLRGRHWKWRMQGGALALAERFEKLPQLPDVLLATDMLHLPAFLGLTRHRASRLPVALYFHENQLTYPWSPEDRDPQLGRDRQYAYINFLSAVAADRVFFNSAYHRSSFLNALPDFLRRFPDQKGLQHLAGLQDKSAVLPLGLDLKALDLPQLPAKPEAPVILWNHRWEYDKNPKAFFRALFRLQEEGLDFRLVVLGEAYQYAPPVFAEARKRLAPQLLHWGYAADRKEYARWLWLADILPVTAVQDFFGGSVVEAIYCNCYPLLPGRLAYPEHLPAGVRAEHLYQDEEGFYQKLRTLVQQIGRVRASAHYQHFVSRYDWSILAESYDKQLAGVSINT